MTEHKFKKGDLVRVEESKECYWKGQVIRIRTFNNYIDVKDINPHSCFYNQISLCNYTDLEPWNPADDVNV